MKIIHEDDVAFVVGIQGCFQHTQLIKCSYSAQISYGRNHMIILIDSEKKPMYSLMIKGWNKLGMEETYPYILKTRYDNL